MHFSLHSDKKKEVDHVQRGPPACLIKPLRRHRPVSFASLTMTLFNRLFIANQYFILCKRVEGKFDVGMPLWSSLKLLLLNFYLI